MWHWKQILAFLFILVPALVFYAMQKRALENSPVAFLQTPAHWVQESYDLFTNQLQTTIYTYFDLIDIKKDNKELQNENGKLLTQLQLLEEYRTENSRLKNLLAFKKDLKRKTVAARIISKDLFIDQKSAVIDKGSEDGLKKLQAVVSPQGVVGYVIAVEKNSSRILLLTDQGANIDSIIQRTRARGITTGLSRKSCQLKYIERSDDVAEGDIVVSSGRQGFFPKGFIIGHVLSVKKELSGVSYIAEIQPAAPINKLEEVLVLTEKKIDRSDSEPKS